MSKMNQKWQDERDELADRLSNSQLSQQHFNEPSQDSRTSGNTYHLKLQKDAHQASHEANFQWEEQLARAIAWEVGQRMHFVTDMHGMEPPTAEVMDIASKWIKYFVKMKLIC